MKKILIVLLSLLFLLPVVAHASEITFDELTIVDNDECIIRVTGIDPYNMWGYTLNVYFENKSPDKTYMYSVSNAAINGVQCDPFFATEVAPGKKANEEINFNVSDLETHGINSYSDIELSFRVYDTNDWSADDVATVTAHVYPYGEDQAERFTRAPQDSDVILVDNEYVTAIVTGYDEDNFWGYTANLFFVNKTDSNVMFSVDDASVNGFMIDPFYAHSVSAGNCSFSSMSWSDSDFEENEITVVEEIEFIISAYNEDDWSLDDYAEELVKLNP